MPKHQDPAQLRAARDDDEVRASAIQFVRKLTGFSEAARRGTSQAFDRAVEQVAHAAHELLRHLVTNAPPRDREIEAAKARARAAGRFGTSAA